MRRLVTGLVAGGLGFAAVTLAALEGREVVVLRTRGADGAVRETRAWIADHEGVAWVEAAHPGREFYRHIERDPHVEVVRAGQIVAYRAVPMPNPEGHRLIRRLLREKYGWADWWIGWLADTSGSIGIRLEPR